MKVVICGYFVNPKYNGNELFCDWLKNVQSFYLTEEQRRIVVYTDNSKLLKYTDENVIVIKVDDDFSNIGDNRLKKMKYLNVLCHSEYVNDVDVISFFQSNLRMKTAVTLNELLPEGYDIAVPFHPSFPSISSFSKLYFNNLAKPVGKSVTDISKLEHSKFQYYQNGHFIGRKTSFSFLVEKLDEMIKEDKRRNIKIIGQPFDERYFNFYLNVKNESNIKVYPLIPKIYNNWNASAKECKIYQINKKTSKFFNPKTTTVNVSYSTPTVWNRSKIPYFHGAAL